MTITDTDTELPNKFDGLKQKIKYIDFLLNLLEKNMSFSIYIIIHLKLFSIFILFSISIFIFYSDKINLRNYKRIYKPFCTIRLTRNIISRSCLKARRCQSDTARESPENHGSRSVGYKIEFQESSYNNATANEKLRSSFARGSNRSTRPSSLSRQCLRSRIHARRERARS